MKLCLCVSGETGAGKTTLVNRLGSMGWSTFHSGDIVRSMKGQILETDSKVSPASADDAIYKALMHQSRKLMDLPHPVLFAVESVPRAPHQVSWLARLHEMGWMVQTIWLQASEKVRHSRVTSRNVVAGDADRQKLDVAKIEEERGHQFLGAILHALATHTHIPAHMRTIPVYNTDSWTADYASEPDYAVLHNMITAGENLFMSRVGNENRALKGDRMARRAMEELQEYLEQGDLARLSSKVEELVDALWFILLAFRSHGLNARQIYQQYMVKNGINQYRLETGTKPHADMDR